MTIFEQFIFIYFISTTALAGFAVLWRNWLHDHPAWKEWLERNLGILSKALTCGSCFTFWTTFFFVLIFDPLHIFLLAAMPSALLILPISYFVQWMSIGWCSVFLRFLYIALQESVSRMVHGEGRHNS